MRQKSLSLIDQLFLLLETEASPKHVGALMIFEKPKNAGPNYLVDLFEETLEYDEAGTPFGMKVSFSPRSLLSWKMDPHFEIENHLFYHKLPARATKEDALELAGDLHSSLLPRDQPLWEMHFIDGIPKKRFGLYSRIHHSYADGVTMTRWLKEALSDEPIADEIVPFYAYEFSGHKGNPGGRDLIKIWKAILGNAAKPIRTVTGLQRIFAQLWMEQLKITRNNVAVPFTSKHTPLTGQVSKGRQVACTQVEMEQISRIRAHTKSTVNHVVLTAIDGAIRRYLDDLDIDLETPLSIQMPVNLRKKDDTSLGNKLGIVLVELATETDDWLQRHKEIGAALQTIRHQVESLPDVSIQAYGILTAVVSQTAELLNISNYVPPLGNTLVSNVPGPPKTLYLGEARLDEYYPISALPPGLQLNITLFSYAGKMNFGLVATKHQLPELQTLADYMAQAFDDLEAAVTSTKSKKKSPPKKKPAAKRKAKAKSKPKKKPAARKKPASASK